MTSLEQIVLPLEQSRALVEHGIVLDTAMAYYPKGCGAYAFDDEGVTVPECQQYLGEPVPCVRAEMEDHAPVCPAPTLGELLDAIRVGIGDADAEFSFARYRIDGRVKMGLTVDWRKDGHTQAFGTWDLLAAAALLMEVTK